MDTHETDRTPPKTRSVRLDCCADGQCWSGSRNNYYIGKRLTPDAFRVEQRYLIERRHLLNRAIHGWGVVYGFGVTTPSIDTECPGTELGRIDIGEGLSLDQTGRELVQTNEVTLTLENVVLLDQKGAPIRTDECDRNKSILRLQPQYDDCWLLRVHYAERNLGPVTLKDSCNCERREWDQICETVQYSLQRVDCTKCCIANECELNCRCVNSPCCTKIDSATDEPKGEEVHDRGGCHCLCDYLSGLQLNTECHSLCEVDKCKRMDLHNGIALACVKLNQDECGNWRFASVHDACGPRRLVKRNDLLFDLIRGCDTTRISEIGWKEWHRREEPIPFDEFSEALGEQGENQIEYVTKGFWVRFSRPVRADTLRPDCFAITVIGSEPEGGWWQMFRVPIVRVDTTLVPPEKGDPAKHVRGARVVVDGAWLEDGVRGRNSIFLKGQTRVEIEVRGDFILDCNEQTVDANARGLSPFPTGGNGPGDAFLSTFTVDKRPDVTPKKAYRQPAEGGKS